MGRLPGVEVVDERTLVIRLVEPQPNFLVTLADPVARADPAGSR